MDQFHSFSMRGRFCSAPWQNWDTALTPRGNLPTGKRHWIDSKAETHGRIANLGGEQWGAQRSNSCSNPALGRHLGAHALRTIQAQVLHGIIAKWRASKSQGTCRNWISTYRSIRACMLQPRLTLLCSVFKQIWACMLQPKLTLRSVFKQVEYVN